MGSPYDVLEISEHASVEVVEAAYKALVQKYSSDTYSDADKPYVSSRLLDIYNAYTEILKYRNTSPSMSYEIPKTVDKRPVLDDLTRYDEKQSMANPQLNSLISRGVLLASAGLLLTLLTYSISSRNNGFYVVFYGAIIWGIIDVCRGIYYQRKATQTRRSFQNESHIILSENAQIQTDSPDISTEHQKGSPMQQKEADKLSTLEILAIFVVGSLILTAVMLVILSFFNLL